MAYLRVPLQELKLVFGDEGAGYWYFVDTKLLIRVK